jgi:arginine/ornithine transport system ATP-binding protein
MSTEASIPSTPACKLRVVDLHKRYGTHEVLKGVSLTAVAGDVIAIIGSSGSGKSTFLRCINLLERPHAGTIEVAGEVLRLTARRDGSLEADSADQLRRLRSRLAMVFQHFNLWAHMTALQNVAEAPHQVMGLSVSEARERARHYLDKVGMISFCDRYPAHLSGGQQQRVAIARALAMEPEVMLFDEPTSALDPERVGEVLQVMRALAEEGRTMIVVTHEIGFAREVSREVLFLDEGRVLEKGDAREILSRPANERLRQFLASTMK